MTGLEKILEEIKKENKETLQNIEAQANKESEDIIKKQEEKLNKNKEAFEKELEQQKSLDIEKGLSAAESQKKKMILKEKQECINNVIDEAKEYILNLPKEEYMNFLERLAVNYAHKEDGKIRLTSKDKESIGDELIKRLNSKLSENSKGSLQLDDITTNEKTGFVIVYGEVEENCSFEAIFSEKRELLEDKINSFLFV